MKKIHSIDGNFYGFVSWETIYTRAYIGESDAEEMILKGQGKAMEITVCK